MYIILYTTQLTINLLIPAKLCHLNFHPLKAVSRYRDPQIPSGGNDSYMYVYV